MLTPQGASNMTESPIFSTSFGKQAGGPKKPTLALQMSMSSQQSEELKLFGQIGKQGLRRLREELEDEELRVDDDEQPIILPLDSKKQSGSGQKNLFWQDFVGDYMMSSSDDNMRLSNCSPAKETSFDKAANFQ
mmetsp:Transcript_16095/g.20428  ORF Transcript_16095/g.20428 Transcript_16095/m.20428 type:complete len:134 (-) Transcript_16095:179-580(-)